MNENINLTEFFEQYYLKQCAELDDKTNQSRIRLMQKYVFLEFGSVKIRDMNTDFIRQLRQYLDSTPLSDSSIYQIFTVIRGILKIAVSMGLISQSQYPLYTKRFPHSSNPVRSPTHSAKPVYFTQDEMMRIDKALGNDNLDLMHRLALHTGLKREELLGLKASDYHKDEKSLSINTVMRIQERGGRTTYEFLTIPQESSRRRTIPLSLTAQETIEAAIDLAQTQEMECCDPYLFRRADGRCYHVLNLRQYAHDIREKSGVERFGLQNLRENFMVCCFRNGWSVAKVRQYIGITSPQCIYPYQRLAVATENQFFRE